MIFKQYSFWVLVVSVLYYVIRYFAPQFPLGEGELLAAVIFILSLFGLEVEKTLRARGFLPRR